MDGIGVYLYMSKYIYWILCINWILCTLGILWKDTKGTKILTIQQDRWNDDALRFYLGGCNAFKTITKHSGLP